MDAPNEQLPPGWTAEWDANNQRYLFIETASGHTQWEPPASQQNAEQAPRAAPSKRRQYAADQTQMYNSSAQQMAPPEMQQPQSYGGSQSYGGEQPQFHQTTGYPAADPTGPQYFTPGEPAYNAPGPGAQQPGYPQQPTYAQQPAFGGQVDALAGQFNQMNMAGPRGYMPQTVNLLNTPPLPVELESPPPPIQLPPNASLSPSPTANADYSYQRCTMSIIPTTSALLSKSKMPLALVVNPYRSLAADEPPIPLVTDTVIARCKRCRMYINPFVQFIDGGNRWRCCMCGMANDVPQGFDWDDLNNCPGDRWSRPELNHGVVEYIAPSEYMARAPQPPAYVFLIDVSYPAVQSGMVATAARTLLESLDRIPNQDDRTKVAIVCFDVSLYFFSMVADSTEPNMLVMSDVDDVFLPAPSDLLVNLAEVRPALEALLEKLEHIFHENTIVGNATGPALQAAFKLVSPTGGKIMVLSASLPSVGEGALKNREDSKILGTSKESSLLQAASPFYKTFAIECSRAHVSVDMFLLSSAYQDVTTLAGLPHYTTGQTYYYPGFNAGRPEDAIKFASEFGKVLAMPIMLEAITRVRGSRGVRMASFHGNFFVRTTDLLAMPAVPQDQSYTIEMEIDETITSPFIVLQTAVLHTTCFGERRVRVLTSALPTTTNIADLFASGDQVALATFFANKAVERCITHKLEDSREYINQKMVDLLTGYKNSIMTAGASASAQLAITENLKSLPLLVLGLIKNVAIRQSSQIPPDLRAYAQALLTSLPAPLLIPYIHPYFYSLHDMHPEAGTVGEHGLIMPQPLPLTSEKLSRHGLFLIEDGQTIFLWIGRDAVPQLVVDVFDIPNYDALRGGKITLPLLENSFSQRVNAIVQKIRESRRGVYHPHLYIVKDDGEPALRLWALSALIQDRADVLPSYQQYLGNLRDKVNGSGGGY